MGKFVRGQVVVLPFPFSDLSEKQSRPALVLANPDAHGDLILCMITASRSARYCVEIARSDFEDGGLHIDPSYVRTYRLFTAETKTVSRLVGSLKPSKMDQVVRELVTLFYDD